MSVDWADEKAERILAARERIRANIADACRRAREQGRIAGLREAAEIADKQIHPDTRTEFTDMGEDGRGNLLIKAKTTSLGDIIRAAADKLEKGEA